MHKILITALHYQLIYSLWYFMTIQLCQQAIIKTYSDLMIIHFCVFPFLSKKHSSSPKREWCGRDSCCWMSFLHEQHMLWVSSGSVVFLLSCLLKKGRFICRLMRTDISYTICYSYSTDLICCRCYIITQ